MRWGDRLELSDEAEAGDFIYIPPYVPHQEINADPNKTCEAVVVRNGQEPVVVNLDLQTPEPASAGHRGMPPGRFQQQGRTRRCSHCRPGCIRESFYPALETRPTA